MITIVLLSIALNFDSFSVSIVLGTQAKKSCTKDVFLLSLIFTTTHIVMISLGSLLGAGFKSTITSFDHWIAFVLLCLSGAKMIKDAFAAPSKINYQKVMNISSLFSLAIAVSIDALVVGISYAFLNSAFLPLLMVLASITFAATFIGFCAGKRLHGVSNKSRILGGIILIGIGLKTLFSHIFS